MEGQSPQPNPPALVSNTHAVDFVRGGSDPAAGISTKDCLDVFRLRIDRIRPMCSLFATAEVTLREYDICKVVIGNCSKKQTCV